MVTKHHTYTLRIAFTMLSLFLLFYNTVAQKENKENKVLYKVEGTLTQSSQYCGGIHPTHEEEAELMRAKPYYSRLYVRKGKKNSTKAPIMDSTTTDSNGHYSFMLPPGYYVILIPSQKDKKILKRLKKMKSKELRVNDLCLIGWWNGGLYKVNVKDKDIGGLDHQFHYRCFVPYPYPCIDYVGPYPP